MYTKSDKSQRATRTDGNGRGGRSFERDSEFINLELNEEQRREFKLFRADLDSVNSVLSEMLEDGYKITCRYDDRNECHACFAFPADGHDNSGYILTGRGGSGLSALAELLYKHSVVMARNWTAFAARSKRRYSDDD